MASGDQESLRRALDLLEEARLGVRYDTADGALVLDNLALVLRNRFAVLLTSRS